MAAVGHFDPARMAQEFGDHAEGATERMRWICQLTAEMPAWPQLPGRCLEVE